MRGDNSSLEGNSEELEKPSRGMKEGAARLRGRILGRPEGSKTTELDGWMVIRGSCSWAQVRRVKNLEVGGG